MFVEGFNPTAKMAAARCPRCRTVGLAAVDSETYRDTPPQDVHVAGPTISPSIYARCGACGLVMDWPGCCWGDADA